MVRDNDPTYTVFKYPSGNFYIIKQINKTVLNNVKWPRKIYLFNKLTVLYSLFLSRQSPTIGPFRVSMTFIFICYGAAGTYSAVKHSTPHTFMALAASSEASCGLLKCTYVAALPGVLLWLLLGDVHSVVYITALITFCKLLSFCNWLCIHYVPLLH